MRLPLGLRLPNPPAHFAGRRAELALLRKAPGPVTLVTGEPGIGKTALVLQALRARADRTIWIAVPASEDPASLGVTVVRALAIAARAPSIAWGELLSDPDALAAAAIDLAADRWIVLDGLERAPSAELVTRLHRYARESRWIATSRFEMDGIPAIALGPMPDAELAKIATRRVAETRGRRASVARARGSPWRLLHAESGSAEIASLDGDAREAAELLSLCEAPVPVEAIGDVRALVKRGLAVVQGERVALHDLARTSTPPLERRAELARRLLAHGEPIEAIRLLLAAGENAAAAKALASLDDATIAREAPRLWALVPAELAAVRMRVATALGTAEALRAIEPVPGERVAWARALLLQSRIADAHAAAEGDDSPDAIVIRARCRILQQRFAEAKAELERAPRSLRRDALLARTRLGLGEVDAARKAFLSLTEKVDGLETGFDVARGLYDTGELADAARVLAKLDPSPAVHQGRLALHLATYVHLDRGDAELAQETIARLQPHGGDASLLAVPLRYAEALRRLIAGELAGLDVLLEAVESDAGENAELADAARALRVRLAALETRDAEPRDASTTVAGSLLRLQLARHHIRRGGAAEIEAPAHPEMFLIAKTIEAEAAIVAGKKNALDLATRAALLAREHGYRVCEWEAWHVAADAAAIAKSRELPKIAAQLSAGTPRFTNEARFFEDLEPAVLEDLAASATIAPIAARRAQALLGGSAPLDAIDRLVLEALPAPGVREILVEPGDWLPGWGVDARTKSVWLPGIRVVPLRKHALLWKLLSVLADRISATKETLVTEVWGEDYHPLRHDNRLHAAIKSLRAMVEDDAKTPQRIVTLENGYALTGPLRTLRSG